MHEQYEPPRHMRPPMQLAQEPPSSPHVPGFVPGLQLPPMSQHPLQSAPAQLFWHCEVVVLHA
jgi:hypothetical protein